MNDKMIKIQCPSCFKIYAVKTESLVHSEPQFECKFCETIFVAYLNEQNLNQENPILGDVIQTKITDTTHSKTCPKCAAINISHARECYSCQVVFEKLKDLPLEHKDFVTPELVQKWSEVLAHYEDPLYHESFIQRAKDLNCLNYALDKYVNILEAQAFDEVALQFKNKIESWQRQSLTQESSSEKSSSINYRSFFYYAPYIISFFILFIGMGFKSFRNMIGFGAAILFLTLVFDKSLKELFLKRKAAKNK